MTTYDLAPAERSPERFPTPAALTALAVGLVADRAAMAGPATIAGALLVGSTGVAVAFVPRRGPLAARVLGVVAALLGGGLVLRASVWVGPLALLAALGAVVLSVVLHRGSALFDLTVPKLLLRAAAAAFDAVRLPSPVLQWLGAARDRVVASPDRRRRVSSYTRGLVLAAGVALLVVPLLAAGDAVFASFVAIDVDLGPLPGHLVLVAMGAAGAGAMLYAASRPERALTLPDGPSLGTAECRVTLATLAAVYAAFAASQLVAGAGGADHVLRTAGLTYAEYARTGFFQLLAAVAMTVAVLLGLRGMQAHSALDDRVVRWLSVAVAGLTLVCVGTAVHRLALYEEAFGLTMLRLYALVAAGWLGLLLVLVAAVVVGVGRGRHWLPGAILVSVLALAGGLTVVNPEAVVVRRNVAHAVAGGTFDATYLAGLSADAVPTLVGQLDRLSGDDRAAVLQQLCDYGYDDETDRDGWAWNRAETRAVNALDSIC